MTSLTPTRGVGWCPELCGKLIWKADLSCCPWHFSWRLGMTGRGLFRMIQPGTLSAQSF